MGGGRHHPRQALVLHDVSADRLRPRRARHVVQQERRQPQRLDGGLRQEPAGIHRHARAPGTVRLTWQATPRNKFNIQWSEQYNSSNTKGGGTATQTPEATGRTLYQPSRQPNATWSSPISGQLLLEAGWGTYQARYRMPAPRNDGTHNPR